MSLKRLHLKIWVLMVAELSLPAKMLADTKTFLFTLPVLTIGREGAIRGEYNLFQKGTIALEWTEWSGKGEREELTNQEMKDNPGSSLRTQGRELGLMYSRYTDPRNMSGFQWGLGAGYRMMKADWTKTASDDDKTDAMSARYNVNVRGPTISGRIGYRFVGDSIGFAIGTFLGLKHFLSHASDVTGEDPAVFAPIRESDRRSLQKKLATSLKLGLEVGWAF